MQNFLYKCEFCTTAKFSTWDKGEVWFIDCMACKSMQFHHKVKVAIHLRMGQVSGVWFECEMDNKKVEDV